MELEFRLNILKIDQAMKLPSDANNLDPDNNDWTWESMCNHEKFVYEFVYVSQ